MDAVFINFDISNPWMSCKITVSTLYMYMCLTFIHKFSGAFEAGWFSIHRHHIKMLWTTSEYLHWFPRQVSPLLLLLKYHFQSQIADTYDEQTFVHLLYICNVLDHVSSCPFFVHYFFLQVQSTYSVKQLFHFSPIVVIIPTLKVLVIIALFQKYHEKKNQFWQKKPRILIVSWLSPSTTIDVWNFIISISIWILSQKSWGATLLKEMTVNVYEKDVDLQK